MSDQPEPRERAKVACYTQRELPRPLPGSVVLSPATDDATADKSPSKDGATADKSPSKNADANKV